MAQHKSAIKSYKQSLKRALRNKSAKSKIRTFVKKLEKSVESQNLQEARSTLSQVESVIMRSVTKRVLKLGTASRKISRLAKKIKALDTLVATT
jgi:small subunit ribosomal protein S20